MRMTPAKGILHLIDWQRGTEATAAGVAPDPASLRERPKTGVGK